jgi:hypothetical protein
MVMGRQKNDGMWKSFAEQISLLKTPIAFLAWALLILAVCFCVLIPFANKDTQNDYFSLPTRLLYGMGAIIMLVVFSVLIPSVRRWITKPFDAAVDRAANEPSPPVEAVQYKAAEGILYFNVPVPDRQLIHGLVKGEVYVVKKGFKYWVQNWPSLTGCGYSQADILYIPEKAMDQIPTGRQEISTKEQLKKLLDES